MSYASLLLLNTELLCRAVFCYATCKIAPDSKKPNQPNKPTQKNQNPKWHGLARAQFTLQRLISGTATASRGDDAWDSARLTRSWA